MEEKKMAAKPISRQQESSLRSKPPTRPRPRRHEEEPEVSSPARGDIPRDSRME